MFQLSRTGALPATSSEFVGRQAQRERLAALIARGARLITVLGPAGIGKTRLAIETLRRDIGLPARWLAAAEADTAAVVAELRGQAAHADGTARVLVLDSCDRLLPTLAPELADLLEADPDLTVLATSREPIGWIDEHLVPVPPLDPPDALRLVRKRIELTGRSIGAGELETGVLTRICHHLDHNPLFLRLAAARMQHRPPAAVLQEVSGDAYDRRLHWSDGARVGVEARHRDIGAAIAWSADRCDATELLLLQRLSVFPADTGGDEGVDLESIVTVCADDALPAVTVESVLDRLVERSLVTVRLTSTSARWALGECVRVYARAELHRRAPQEANRLTARYRRLRHADVHDDRGTDRRLRCRPAAQRTASPTQRAEIVAPQHGPESDGWALLSRAEREVAVLAAAGLPNSAIAGRRRSSVRTVDAQVAMVRQKLRITSRAQIARHLPGDAAERMRREAARAAVGPEPGRPGAARS
ncbi:LuxR C-terminal-related transcriptional regulator [Nocardia veterana]|uniref:LuxR family transcriptional regulator n=1 Tax=Nocardia veterana TaxID=132249 RepID=A0A7X6LZ32_9NOCA|nr:AAA family ATPase [Nocardia veterana]NKY87264.1 LuxR family transcriptional regulator [Nocardia veterana]